MAAPTQHDVEDRHLEAKAVIQDYLRKQTQDTPLDTKQIIADHAGLMPELGRELRKVELIQRARRNATSGAGGDGRAPATLLRPDTLVPSLIQINVDRNSGLCLYVNTIVGPAVRRLGHSPVCGESYVRLGPSALRSHGPIGGDLGKSLEKRISDNI